MNMKKQVQEQPHTRTARWNVTKLNAIPSFGLDRRAKQINASATDVAKRVDEYLRLSSIVTKFHSTNATATCKTKNFIRFEICLYEGPEGSTYVEVIKTKGCGFSFIKERENIINTAEQKVIEKDNSKHFGSVMTVPPSFLDSYEPPSQNELETMVTRACDRLHSSNREDVIFILENLVSLTAVDRLTPDSGRQMSALIMQHNSNIRDMILSIYIANEPIKDDDEEVDETSERICIACLSILTNGIRSICDKKQSDFLDHECKDFIERLVPSLISSASNYEKSTENACIALACLCTLICNSSVGRKKVKETDVLNILEEARMYGCREHLRLENGASAAIETLSKIC
jgi:hypothetical protein